MPKLTKVLLKIKVANKIIFADKRKCYQKIKLSQSSRFHQIFKLRKDIYGGKEPFEKVVSNTLNFGQKQSHCGDYLVRDESPIIYKEHHPEVDTAELEKVT